MVVFAGEWGLAVEEFEEEDSQAPDVQSEIMRLVQDHFWGHVVEGPTEGLP